MRFLLFLTACFMSLAANSQELSNFEKLLQLERAKRFPFSDKLYLSQNYPNPVSSNLAAIINYRAIDVACAQLVIYNEQGVVMAVHTLVPGVGEFRLNPGELAPGMYSYALVVNGRRISRKKLLVID